MFWSKEYLLELNLSSYRYLTNKNEIEIKFNFISGLEEMIHINILLNCVIFNFYSDAAVSFFNTIIFYVLMQQIPGMRTSAFEMFVN